MTKELSSRERIMSAIECRKSEKVGWVEERNPTFKIFFFLFPRVPRDLCVFVFFHFFLAH